MESPTEKQKYTFHGNSFLFNKKAKMYLEGISLGKKLQDAISLHCSATITKRSYYSSYNKENKIKFHFALQWKLLLSIFLLLTFLLVLIYLIGYYLTYVAHLQDRYWIFFFFFIEQRLDACYTSKIIKKTTLKKEGQDLLIYYISKFQNLDSLPPHLRQNTDFTWSFRQETGV